MIARRLLLAAAGGGSFTVPVLVFPDDYTTTRFAGNPIITVTIAEPAEQYEPAPLELANGDVWVYVKGAADIYAYKSTDGGETFAIQNGGSPVVASTSGWDANFVVEPTVVYDEASGTIHLWYKGRDAGVNNWAWGHATADDSDPTDFTKDVTNPILDYNDVSTALGGGSIEDFGVSCVLKVGSSFKFYGYASHAGQYKLVHATGTTWNDPGSIVLDLNPGAGNVVFRPAVWEVPDGTYTMLYTHGNGEVGVTTTGSLKLATSADGDTWTFPGTTFLSPQGSGWEEYWAYGANMLRVNTDPYSLPIVDGLGRWRLYYSGQADGPASQTGLAYIEPT